MRRMLFCAAISAALLAFAPVFAAEDAATNAAEPSEAAPAAPDASAKPVLTPEELAEKEARKECKKKICDIIATRDPNGEDVACDITKTWREEDIVKMLGGKISWPWGKAVPMFIYPLIYASTGFDNSANVLGPEVVHLVNEFATKKCTEVKAEAPASNP